MSAHLISLLVGGVLLIGAAYKLNARLALSRAKHRSLRGHARIGLWLAKRGPFYEYDAQRVFRSDAAPADVAERRRNGFMRLAGLFEQRFHETQRLTDETAP